MYYEVNKVVHSIFPCIQRYQCHNSNGMMMTWEYIFILSVDRSCNQDILMLWRYILSFWSGRYPVIIMRRCTDSDSSYGRLFHIDGFMDTMDAFHSYKPREEKLTILKDSHMGAFAVIMLAACSYYS